MNAWLLTWEGTCGAALIPEKKLIAILSARRSSSAVADLVDVIYCRSRQSAYDMAALANKRKTREREFMHLGSTFQRFFYGRNPCIFARVVINLKVERDEMRNTETVFWTELPAYQNAPSGSVPMQIGPAQDCQLIRTVLPLENAD